jgi:hypothetical protein
MFDANKVSALTELWADRMTGSLWAELFRACPADVAKVTLSIYRIKGETQAVRFVSWLGTEEIHAGKG